MYEGTSVYIVIEISQNKMYDKLVALDDINLGIDISYYDVESDKQINTLLNSLYTSANNEHFETLIKNVKSGNRPRIKPCSNVLLLDDSSSSDDFASYYS